MKGLCNIRPFYWLGRKSGNHTAHNLLMTLHSTSPRLRDVFLWPLPFAPAEDARLPLEQRVRLDAPCSTRRARRAVKLAIELMRVRALLLTPHCL
jgi:hypothetical protein